MSVPVATPVATPVAAPVATPVAAPVATPAASPYGTPAASPYGTPAASPYGTPAAFPYGMSPYMMQQPSVPGEYNRVYYAIALALTIMVIMYFIYKATRPPPNMTAAETATSLEGISALPGMGGGVTRVF